MHTSLANSLNIKPDPNSAIPITQLDGTTLSDGRHIITLTIGEITKNIEVHIHRRSPCPLLIGRHTGRLFNLEISLRQNQVYQYRPNTTLLRLSNTSFVASQPHTDELAAVCPVTSEYTDEPAGVCSATSEVTDKSAAVCPVTSEHTPTPAAVCSATSKHMPTLAAVCPATSEDTEGLAAVCPATSEDTEGLAAVCPATSEDTEELAAVCPVTSEDTHEHATVCPATSEVTEEPKKVLNKQLNFKYTKNRSSTRMITLQSLLNDFKSVFASSKNDIGRINGTDHYIRLLDNSRPIYRRHYRHSIAELNEIRKQVSALLDKGLIRKSKSPWAFPVTLANKSDGTLRLCIDYRPLNAITIDEREPIPIVQDIIDKLAKAKVFSVLDMAWGYWHVPIHPESIDKTAFITPDGHYEWLVLPFGLKNAPATFQRIVREVLGELLDHGVIPYFDDIIVYSETIPEHLRLLYRVFLKLKQANVRLRYEKCRFGQPEVEYLGFVVSHGKQKPSPAKTSSVANYPTPTSVKAIQRFIGLANYYRRFVPNFSRIAEPLTRLTRKNTEFVWGPEQQSSFDSLQRALTTEPVIAIYDPSKPVVLYTDASKIGIGAVLMQKDQDNHNHVVAYFSRRLNQHEANYSASELEVLAVVDSLEHFHVYVHGRHTHIFSDHAALQWLFSLKKPTSRLYRWSVRLSVYTYTIHHRAGKLHQVPDALSRDPVALFSDIATIKQAQSKTDVSSIHKLTEQDGILYNSYRGIKRIFIPESLRPQLCQHFHDNHGHPGISKTIQLILAGYWWPNSTDEITQYVKSCKTCQLVKKSNQPTIGLTNPPPTPSLPMETWALDTIVMGSSANNTRAKYIQLIVDHHSRYVWAYATPKNTTATIINILTQLFTAVGKPQTLTTDNFKSFQAKQFRRFLSERNIRHIMCSPYHPQSNGICEKANDTIVRGLRLARFDQPNLKWSTLLSDVVNNYNRTPHSATGFAPKFLHFAESENETSTDINEARKLAKVRSDSFKDQRKHNFDERHKPSNFTPGDLVIRILPDNHPTKLKLSPAHTGPFVIREQLGPETYRISPEAGVSSVYTAHASQLRRFLPRVETHGVGGVRRTDETEPSSQN